MMVPWGLMKAALSFAIWSMVDTRTPLSFFTGLGLPDATQVERESARVLGGGITNCKDTHAHCPCDICTQLYGPCDICMQLYVVGFADNVLIREVSLIQSALYREVPLYNCVYTIFKYNIIYPVTMATVG